MKRFRDAPDNPDLDPAPIPDARATPWYQFLGEIQDLRASDAYLWAEDTLAAIQMTVERTQRVTEGQQRAIAGIRATVRTPSRVYDKWGFGRRW